MYSKSIRFAFCITSDAVTNKPFRRSSYKTFLADAFRFIWAESLPLCLKTTPFLAPLLALFWCQVSLWWRDLGVTVSSRSTLEKRWGKVPIKPSLRPYNLSYDSSAEEFQDRERKENCFEKKSGKILKDFIYLKLNKHLCTKLHAKFISDVFVNSFCCSYS